MGTPQANSTIKSKATQNLFNESRMSYFHVSAINNKDDSNPINISTSTAVGNKHEIPHGFSFSPVLSRMEKMIAERLAPLATLQQSMLNSVPGQSHPLAQPGLKT